MANNNYSWNQTLKFSWGHIIAFIALIFISYVMYMGDFYRSGGNFTSAAIKVGIIDLCLLATFIGAQIIKGTDEKFNRSIIIERLLICLCPVVFLFAMFSYNHFWSVFEHRQQIENNFNASIEGAMQMFVSYESYSKERIGAYKSNLDTILIEKGNGNTSLYGKAGFTGSNDQLKKENYVHTLELQLRSQNVDSLEHVAKKWIDDANQGASVWNAFLIGNVDQISDAIKTWHKTLQEYSKESLSNEFVRGNVVSSFDENGDFINGITKEITSLKDMYIQPSGVKIQTIWTGIILFLMLLFPYFLQKRNTRAEGLYFLIPGMKAKSNIRSSGYETSHKVFKKSKPTITKYEDKIDSQSPSNENSDDDLFSGTF